MHKIRRDEQLQQRQHHRTRNLFVVTAPCAKHTSPVTNTKFFPVVMSWIHILVASVGNTETAHFFYLNFQYPSCLKISYVGFKFTHLICAMLIFPFLPLGCSSAS